MTSTFSDRATMTLFESDHVCLNRFRMTKITDFKGGQFLKKLLCCVGVNSSF